MKMIRKFGICVTERDDGTYKVTGPAPWNGLKARWEMIAGSFFDAGQIAFEMADNNDQGRELNRLMCKTFGKVFFND